MNRSFATAIVTLSLAAAAHAQMSKRESHRIDQGKITKNEAQHLVQNAFPGAKIQHCKLHNVNGHAVWNVDLVKSGQTNATTVQVDGRTGQIQKPD